MKREFIFTDKWSDIVFQNRNQSYGAYMLRKRLPRNILIGYLSALLFIGTVIFTGYQFSKISIEDIKGIIDQLPPAILYEVTLTPPVSLPEKKPKSENPPSKPAPQNIIPVVIDSTDDSENKEKISKSDDVSESKDTSGSGNNDNDMPADAAEPKTASVSNEPLPVYGVEKRPEFPGGESAMIKFIQKNTRIPGEYMNEEISKTVYITFIVDTAGKVYLVRSEKGDDDYPKLAGEAIKTVTKMPRWKPGQQNGMNVSVIMTLPVKFSVKKDF